MGGWLDWSQHRILKLRHTCGGVKCWSLLSICTSARLLTSLPSASPTAASWQVGRRTHLGDTTESTDLTELSEFVGPPGSGAANAQVGSQGRHVLCQGWPEGLYHMPWHCCHRLPHVHLIDLTLLCPCTLAAARSPSKCTSTSRRCWSWTSTPT